MENGSFSKRLKRDVLGSEEDFERGQEELFGVL